MIDDIETLLGGSSTALTLDEYQDATKHTNRTGSGLVLPFLGLFGETGSLLSEIKKKQRDMDSYSGYEPTVLEELGDVLWYFTTIVSHANVRLSSLVHHSLLSDPNLLNTPSRLTFLALQPHAVQSSPVPRPTFEAASVELAEKVGALMQYAKTSNATKMEIVSSPLLQDILKLLVRVANEAGVTLADAAQANLRKIFDRWPLSKIYPPLFDDRNDSDEQLSRQLSMIICEQTVGGYTYVVQKCNGIKIGDRLTDNILEPDDYRFHDVFHLSYAAYLGWSPVLRSLFRNKRKSNPIIDETEDGARAILIEEGVSTWIFNHAKRMNYFANLNSLEYGLLKAVRDLVKGYESEQCPLWLWEEAILSGYKAFRLLCEHRQGLVKIDLRNRTLKFERITS